jgi:hypothetical protein
MTMTLPNTLRRAELRSFCLAWSGIALIVLALVTGFSGVFVYAAPAILCGCLVGLVYPGLIRIPYRIWNKSAKLFARFACVYIMALSFHLIVRWAGLAAPSGECSKPGTASSSWVPHGPATTPAYGSQYQAADACSARASWPVGYLAWAWRTGNITAIFLLPFLMMLSVFQPEEEASQLSDIYTLF